MIVFVFNQYLQLELYQKLMLLKPVVVVSLEPTQVTEHLALEEEPFLPNQTTFKLERAVILGDFFLQNFFFWPSAVTIILSCLPQDFFVFFTLNLEQENSKPEHFSPLV